MAARNYQGQTGFTLIEMLVAMTLGILLLLGMFTVFNGTRESGRLQSGIASTNDAARAALDYMGRSILQAGLREDPLDTFAAIDAAATTDGGSKSWNINDVDFATDALAIEYDGDINCAGQVVTHVRHVFSIVDDALICTTQDASGTETSVTLLNGVEDLQFLYGEDRVSGDGEAVPTAYVRADEVSDWTLVLGIEVSLQVSSQDRITGSDANVMQDRFDLLQQGGYPADDATMLQDARYRIALSSRYGVRNQAGAM